MASPKKKATPRLVRASTRLKKLSGSFLECREMRHSWDKIGYFEQGMTRTRIARCTRCESSVRVRMLKDGTILSRTYTYAPGYLLNGSGRGGVTAIDVRVAAMGIATIFASEDELLAAVLGKPVAVG